MTQPLSRTHSASSSFAFSYYQAIIPYILLITLLCSSTQFAWARRKDKDQPPNLAKALADRCIKPFASDDEDEKKRNYNSQESSQKPAYHIDLPKLDPATVRKIIFHFILVKSKKFDGLQQYMELILNEYAWDDLKLFSGTPSDPGYHLLSRINRTTTTLGEAVLASLLATPTSNLEVLRERQHIIQTLLDNPRAVEELESTLQTYEDGEQSFLSLWTKTDPLCSKEYTEYMKKFGLNTASKSAGFLELNKRFWCDLVEIYYPWMVWNIPMTFPIFQEINALIQGKSLTINDRLSFWGFAIPFYRPIVFYQYCKHHLSERFQIKYPTVFLINSEIFDGLVTFDAYQGYKKYQEYSYLLRNLALRMADVQTFITTATQISETIAASPALEKVYGKHLTSIRQLLAQAKENTELGRLIHYLQHLPLQNWNYFLNNAGKLLASFKLFIEHKDAFADAIYELGQLDAYLSLATLVQEAQANDSNHGYTFVKFLNREQKSTPYIKIDQMWNPFLDPKQAVGNSIEMDGAPGGVRNMILTGPNAGGKSTFLTGVLISLLLSQTFGIAPAQEAVITPFNKINSNIEKSDDIAAAESLFMAEVKRVQKLLNTIKGLKDNEFSFTVTDEIFVGTDPEGAAASAIAAVQALADCLNSLSIVATHYPTVTRLEELAPDKGFVNYKVYSTRDSAGKIHYTYKIVLGKSNQAIAIDILEEQGFDVSTLKSARQITADPEQYQAALKENSGEPEDLVQYKPGGAPGTEEGEEDAEDLVQYNTDSTASTVVTED